MCLNNNHTFINTMYMYYISVFLHIFMYKFIFLVFFFIIYNYAVVVLSLFFSFCGIHCTFTCRLLVALLQTFPVKYVRLADAIASILITLNQLPM